MTKKADDVTANQHSIYDLISFKMANFVNSNERSSQLLMLRRFDITLIEFRIIGLIDTHQEIAASSIQNILTLDKGQLSRTIKKLKSQSLVTTTTDPEDKRSSLLILTEQGKAKYAELYPMIHQRNQYILSSLDEDEVALLFKLIDKMKPNIDERLEYEEQATSQIKQ